MADNDFVEFVLDQMHAVPGIRCRRMFGAVGVYAGDVFFAIVNKGRLYFVTSHATRDEYVSRGMKAFRTTADQTLKRYYEVPVDVLEDDTTLCAWALAAVAAQRGHAGGRNGKATRKRRKSNEVDR